MSALRAIIVDDEAPARHRIATMLRDAEDITVIAECSNGLEAVEEILRLHPDIVFLDVQMPEMTGFDVIEFIGADAIPALVFVTAFDQYALKAFDARAIDYLLKPFTSARFDDALARARRMCAVAANESRTSAIADVTRALAPAAQQRLAARDGDRIVFLNTRDIEYIEGAGNYVRLHAGGRDYRLRATLKHTASRLHTAGFRRISHSCIVNRDRVTSATRNENGNYELILAGGMAVATTRSYAASMKDLA